MPSSIPAWPVRLSQATEFAAPRKATISGRVTQSLFYATDFVDRLENEIVPALRAGFIVLTDRYIYSLMARAIVRGMDPAWIRSIFAVALKPDAIFYLRVGIDQLVPRVIFSRGFRLLGIRNGPLPRPRYVR